jgi:hypothetical protein
MKLKCILGYNKDMDEIDHQEQLLTCFPIMKKILEGYIIYETIHGQRKKRYVDYRINIAEIILQNVQLPNYEKHGKPSLVRYLFFSKQLSK